MSIDEPSLQTRSTVEDMFSALRAHDLEQFRTRLDEEAVMKNPATGTTHEGPKAIVEAIRPVLQAFPDLEPEVRTLVVEGRQAAVEVVRKGTHTEELDFPNATIPPTYQEVALPECLILEVREAKVVSITAYTDRQTLTEQLEFEERAS